MKKAVFYSMSAVFFAIVLLGCSTGTEKQDTAFADKNPLHEEVDSLNRLAWSLKGDNPKDALAYVEIALQKAQDANYQEGMGDAHNVRGVIYRRLGHYEKAVENHSIAMSIRKQIGDSSGVGIALNNKGLALYEQGKYETALQTYFKALRIFDKLQDTLWISNTYNNIGLVFTKQERYDEALVYYEKDLQVKKDLLGRDSDNVDYKKGVSFSYNNMGIVHIEKGDLSKALEYYYLSLKTEQDVGDKSGISISYNNIAEVYWKEYDYERAIEYFKKSLSLAKEIEDKEGVARVLMSLGAIQKDLGHYSQAIQYLDKSLILAQEIGNLDLIQNIYVALDLTYASMGNISKAYEYRGFYREIRDSLINETNALQLAEMQTRYETEKKESENKLLKKENDLQDTRLYKQRIAIWSAVGGILLLFLLVLLVLRSKKLLGKQKDAIEKQKDTIKRQKEHLDDSIIYAKHIQTNMVLPEEEVLESLPESFRLWKPRDIVSGDFPWFANGEKKKLIAAADCTGHGVPGAFVSTVCIDKLNDAIREGLTDPGEILQFANKKIKQTLRQGDGEGSSRDGMDIALCTVEPYGSETKMQFAGANNPVWIVRNSDSKPEFEEIRETKSGLGGDTPDDKVFETHSVILHNGDAFYIFSDGYADQFGGPNNRKLMKKQMKEFILSIQGLSMPEQKAFLEKSIEKWMHPDYEQVDDMLVIGVRV